MTEVNEKKRLTDHFTIFAEKWVPDSYVIALDLTGKELDSVSLGLPR